MSDRLSLWDLYQKQSDIDQRLTSHTHDYSQLTGFHSVASTGRADSAVIADKATKVSNVLTLKNTSGTNVTFDGSSAVNLSSGVYYATTANSATNASNSDTLDGLHSHQMATLSEAGASHGTTHVLTCQYNAAADGRFMFKTSGGHQVRCDYSTVSATSSVANHLSCTNYGTPIEIGQYIDFHQYGTNTDYSVRLTGTVNTLTCSGTFTATKVYNAVWNDYAEWFERKDESLDLEAGDILAWDGKGVVKADKSHKNVVGVFSDTYGHIVGGEQLENMEDNIKKFVPVGLNGRIKVKVKGNVNEGDFIILSSDTPGVGVAGSFIPGIIVGKALEKHVGDNIDRISVLIMTI